MLAVRPVPDTGTSVASPSKALGWLLGISLTAMGAIAFLAALLPFLPGDARWEIAVLGPVARATLVLTLGLCLLGALAVVTSAMRMLVAVLVASAFLLAALAVGVVTVLLDLWLLTSPSGFGRSPMLGLERLALEGALQGTVAAAAAGVVSAHFAAAYHALRARR